MRGVQAEPGPRGREARLRGMIFSGDWRSGVDACIYGTDRDFPMFSHDNRPRLKLNQDDHVSGTAPEIVVWLLVASQSLSQIHTKHRELNRRNAFPHGEMLCRVAVDIKVW